MSEPYRKMIPILGVVLCLAISTEAQTNNQAADALIAKLDCPDRVKDVAFSPDAKLLAAGYGWNDRGGVTIWNVADQRTVATLAVGKGNSANIECVAYGHLDQLNTSFESMKNRLVGEVLLSVPKEPLTLGADHYRTRFIGLASGGAPELRSDADSIEVLLKGGPAKKREAFSRIFSQEEQFINSLLRAGLRPPQK